MSQGSKHFAKSLLQSDLSAHYDLFYTLLHSEAFIHAVTGASECIVSCFHNKGRLLICGNGGSAADAQHISAEFSGKFLINRPPLDAEAISTNTSNLTAIGNDFGFDVVFSRQVAAKGKEGDVFIGISTSGSSKNVLAALQTAKDLGMNTIMLVGCTVNETLERYSDFIITIPSSETPRIQEAHIFTGHAICNIVEQQLFAK